MSSVDDRIVNMTFNNKQFESGVATSEKSLNGLEKTLQNTAKSKGLVDLASSAVKVSQKFSIMQIAGTTAIATIANKAVNAGIKMAKSLTLDPMTQGFQEYQTNLNSIQTVMSNTGKSVDVVNGYMNKLNNYSDQTIYNFSEMARNVGTFTAAGVDLKTSASAIQGIANLAALSGSSSQQASTAMYQLSQAIAAGRVGLQDWNSVVNAGMGGKQFQTALATTAQAMGTIGKGAVTTSGKMKNLKINGEAFRTSISAGPGKDSWLTSDVLTTTLKYLDGRLSRAALRMKGLTKEQINNRMEIQKAKLATEGYTKSQIHQMVTMANAAFKSATTIKTLPQLVGVVQESIGSIWSQVFAGILGNFDQSKKLWTDVGNSISTQINRLSRTLVIFNKKGQLTGGVLGEWQKAGGRDSVIAGLGDIFKALGKIMGSVGKAFRDVFPPNLTSGLIAFSKNFEEFASHLDPSVKLLENLRSIFGGFFSLFHIYITITSALRTAIVSFFDAIFDNLEGSNSGILDFMASIGELIKSFDKWLNSGNKLNDTMKTLGTVLGLTLVPLIKGIALLGEAFAALVSGKGIEGFMEPFKGAKEEFGAFIAKVAGGLEELTKPLGKVSDFFAKIKKQGEDLKTSVGGVFGGGGEKSSGVAKAGETISAGFQKVSASTDGAKESVNKFFGELTGNSAAAAQSSVDGISQTAEESSSKMAVVGDTIGQTGDHLKTGFEALGKVIDWIGQRIQNLFAGFDSLDFASLMNALFTGALILTLKNVTKQFGGLASSFSSTFTAVKDTLGSMQKELKAKALMAIAIALGVMTAALIALSLVPAKKIAIGLGALAAMAGILTVAFNALNDIAGESKEDASIIDQLGLKMPVMAAAIALLAAAMLTLAFAVKVFSSMSVEELARGLGAMAVGMGILLGSMRAFSTFPPGAIEGFAASVLVLSLAMNAMAAAVILLGKQDMKTLEKGIGSLALVMGIMTASLFVLGKVGKNAFTVEGAAGAVLAMATAMVILSGAVLAFGSMNLKTLGKGFGAVAIGMGLMVGALILLSANAEGSLAAAAAMILMATAMNMLVSTVIIMGNLDWGTILKGITAMTLLAIPILAVGAAATVVAPGLLALGIAIGLVGAAMALAGIGMLAFATGFALLAVSGVAGMAVITVAIQAFLALLPSIAIQIAASFVAFIQAIANASDEIRTAFDTIFQNILGVITDNIQPIGDLFQQLINTAIGVLNNSIPQFIELGFTVIDSFLQSADKHVPSIVKTVSKLIQHFMSALGDEVGPLTKSFVHMVTNALHGLADTIRSSGGEIGSALVDVGTAIPEGIAKGIAGAGKAALHKAIEDLTDLVPGWVKDLWGINSPAKVFIPHGEYLGAGVAKGIDNSTPVVKRSATNMADTAVDAVKTTMRKAATAIAHGVGQATQNAVAAAVAGANAIIAGGNAKVLSVQQTASDLQAQADRAQANADLDATAAKNAKGKKAKKKTKAAAKKSATAATSAQAKADAAASAVQDTKKFEEADDAGKGDIFSEKSTEAAAAAQKYLQKANSEYAKAATMHGASAKKMRALAAKDAAAAQAYANQAIAYDAQAQAAYGAAVTAKIDALVKEREDDAQARKDAADYAAADNQGKVDIMQKKMDAAKIKAEEQNKEAQRLIDLARSEAATNSIQAEKDLALAQAASDAAKAAADEAEQAQQTIDGLLNNSGSTSGTITPSRTALEDASKAVDTYTASVSASEEAIQAEPKSVQFIQNNTSPVALSPAEVYRQTNNLLSAAEVKMVG